MQNVQVRFRQLPEGVPTPDDFDIVEAPTPAVSAGQILCRARWLSLDAHHLRPALNGRLFPGGPRRGDLVPSRAVAEVVESRNDVFAVGACVELEHGLQVLSVSDGLHAHALRPAQNPPSTALGILGVPGMTAYFGLLDVARLQPRETVLVSAAAGAVGAMVGQIAKLRGARAIGIANTREKCEWVTRTARFSACIDHASEDLSQRVGALAPNGVDVYFEDIPAGEILRTIVKGRHLAANARIVLRTGDPPDLGTHTADRAKILAINVAHYAQRRDEFLREAMAWYGQGLLVYREDVVEGLHKAPAHFCKLMHGESFGKTLVRV